MRQSRHRICWALLLCLIFPSAVAYGTVGILPRTVSPPPASQSARDAVAQGAEQWTAAWQAHDAARLTALFAADGMELGRGGVVFKGREAVMARYKRLFGAIGPVQAVRQTADLWLLGKTAYESGRYTLTFPAGLPGQKAAVSSGNYVTVWQQQQDGHWLIHSEVLVSAQ